MAQDLVEEGLLPLVQAVRESGLQVSVWTALRWTRSSVGRGPRLESLKVGGRHYTSLTAVRRWIALQNRASGDPEKAAEAGGRPKNREAVEYLSRVGLGRETNKAAGDGGEEAVS